MEYYFKLMSDRKIESSFNVIPPIFSIYSNSNMEKS